MDNERLSWLDNNGIFLLVVANLLVECCHEHELLGILGNEYLGAQVKLT